MKAKRTRHDPEFKARVALEALKGIKTIQQIAKDFDVHPVQVSEWKKTMVEGAPVSSVPAAARPRRRTSSASATSFTPRSGS
jgi:transposase/putative transposase